MRDNLQKITYFHLRVKNEDGTISPKGGLSCGWIINKEKNELRFAFAACSIDDNFNKSTARFLISNRLAGKNFQVLTKDQLFIMVNDSISRRLSSEISSAIFNSPKLITFKQFEQIDFEISELSYKFISSIAEKYIISQLLKKSKGK